MKPMVQRLRQVSDALAPPERLAMLRILIGAYALRHIWIHSGLIAALARYDNELFHPVGPIRILTAPLNPGAVDAMLWLTIISGIAFVFGVRHRIAGPAFSILFLLTIFYRTSWSMIFHSENAVAFHLLILGFTRSADALSLDARLRASSFIFPEKLSPDYARPIYLICAVTASIYLLAGLAKVLSPHGFGWMHGTVLREQVAADAIRKVILEGSSMQVAHRLYDQVWLFTWLGVGTFVLELGAPLFHLHPLTRRIWALSTFCMHWGIYFIMGITFDYQLCFAMFLPYFHVEKPALWLRPKVKELLARRSTHSMHAVDNRSGSPPGAH